MEMPSSSRNAGGLVIQVHFDSAMRSLLVAIYELGVEEIMVIAHSNCGACHMNGQQMKELMLKRGIHQDVIDTIGLCGINLDHWLEGFHDTEDSVRNTINTIRTHLLYQKMSICMVTSSIPRRVSSQKLNKKSFS